MLEGTVQYAYDFVGKIPLVKREAFQVTLDLVGEKRPAAKQAQPNQFYDNSLAEELIKERFFQIVVGTRAPVAGKVTLSTDPSLWEI